MHPPCPPYKQPAHYELECLLVDILAEEKRIDHEAASPFFQIGYLKSLFSEMVAGNACAKLYLEERLKMLQTLKTKYPQND